MAKNPEKLLGDRTPGELIETGFDFVLGMAGAVGRGMSVFTDIRREKKAKNESTDFLSDATDAFAVTMKKAQEVTAQTQHELKTVKNGTSAE